MRAMLLFVVICGLLLAYEITSPPPGCDLKDIVRNPPHGSGRNVVTSDTYCRHPVPQ